MPDIRDVTHQQDIIAVIVENAANPVGRGKRAQVAEVCIFIDGWAARVDAHARRMKRLEQLFLSGQGVIYINRSGCSAGHKHKSPLVLCRSVSIAMSRGSNSDKRWCKRGHRSIRVHPTRSPRAAHTPYVHRGLSYCHRLYERQDRSNTALVNRDASRSSPKCPASYQVLRTV